MSSVYLVLCAAGLSYLALLNRFHPMIAAPLRLYTELLIAPILCGTAGVKAGRRGMRRFFIPGLTAVLMLPALFLGGWVGPLLCAAGCLAGEWFGRSHPSREKGRRQERR